MCHFTTTHRLFSIGVSGAYCWLRLHLGQFRDKFIIRLKDFCNISVSVPAAHMTCLSGVLIDFDVDTLVTTSLPKFAGPSVLMSD